MKSATILRKIIKAKLDMYLSTIPDEPTIPDQERGSETNSLETFRIPPWQVPVESANGRFSSGPRTPLGGADMKHSIFLQHCTVL